MKGFNQRERFALSAAEGWLMLGCPVESERELEAIGSENFDRPEVLCLRWAIAFRLKRWKDARSVAEFWCWTAMDSLEAWMALANATRESDGLEKAKKLLLRTAAQFPCEWVIPYNLACYCTQLGEIAEAVLWLNRALALDTSQRIQQAAADDPDLAPLWKILANEEPAEHLCS